jgi:hypothetical protein
MVLDVKSKTGIDLILDRFAEVEVVFRVIAKFPFLLVTDSRIVSH